MSKLGTSLSTARQSLRLGRGAFRTLSLLVVSVIGLGTLGAAAEAQLEDDAERNGRVVFRHFL